MANSVHINFLNKAFFNSNRESKCKFFCYKLNAHPIEDAASKMNKGRYWSEYISGDDKQLTNNVKALKHRKILFFENK